MKNSVLDQQLVLVLNASWQPIGIRTVRQAIISLCSETEGEHPSFAMDMEYIVDENGGVILISAVPTDWIKWAELPIRKNDPFISTSCRKIRVPTVIIAKNFNKMPMKKTRLTSKAIWDRDNGTCQYSGKKLSRSEANLDHVIPRSRGGKDHFENLVLADKKINSMKGDKMPHEAGLKLIRKPKAPAPLPVSATIREVNHLSWKPFLVL